MVLGWHRNVSYHSIARLAGNCLPGFSDASNLSDFLVFFSDSSCSLLADDVLGSYLLCPHPKKANYGSLVVRVPSGLVTHLVESTRKGTLLVEVRVGQAEGLGGSGSQHKHRGLCPGPEGSKLRPGGHMWPR